MVLRQACNEAIWVQRFMKEISSTMRVKYNEQPITIYANNQGSMALAKNPESHSRTKHISIQQHFIRKKVAEEKVQLQYLPT